MTKMVALGGTSFVRKVKRILCKEISIDPCTVSAVCVYASPDFSLDSTS